MNRRATAVVRTSPPASSSSSACSASGSDSSATAAASATSNGSPATAPASSSRRASGASAASSAASAEATAGGTVSSIADADPRRRAASVRAARGRTGCRRPAGRSPRPRRRPARSPRPRTAVPAAARRTRLSRCAPASASASAGGTWPSRAATASSTGAGGRAAHEGRGRVDGSRIGPVHVVQPDDQGSRGGEPFEQVAQRSVGSMPIAWCHADVPQRGQHAASAAGSAEPHPRDAMRAEVREVAVERLRPQRVREIVLELRRARAEHGRAVRRSACGEMVEQPRLADPRLPLDRDDRPWQGSAAARRRSLRALRHGRPAGRATRRARSDPRAYHQPRPG